MLLLIAILIGSMQHIIAHQPIRCFNYTNQTLNIRNASGDSVLLAPDAAQNILFTNNQVDWSITSHGEQTLRKSAFFNHSKYLSFKNPFFNATQVVCEPDTGDPYRKIKLAAQSFAEGFTWGLIQTTKVPTLASEEFYMYYIRQTVRSYLITTALSMISRRSR